MKRSQTLAANITVTLTIGLVVIVGLSTWIIGREILREAYSIIDQKNTHTLALQADNAALPLWNFDTFQAQAIVDNLIKDDSILGAEIKSNYGDLHVTAGKKLEDVQKDEEDYLLMNHDVIYLNHDQKINLGTVNIIADHSKVREQIQKLGLRMAAIVSILLAILIGIIYLVSRYAVRPIAMLSRAMLDKASNNESSVETSHIESHIVEVTQLLQASDQMQQHNLTYQHNLMMAKEQAEKASRVKSEFLANMSHELRTPLNSILGMVGIVMAEDDLKPDTQEMLGIVDQSARNLLEIVNDVLDISKIESNAIILEKIGFDFPTLLNGIMQALAPIASGKGIALNCTYKQQDMPYIKGDPARLRRIITNLISNAVKYTDKGQVDVTTSFRENGDGQIVLECAVIDTGIGIPENKLGIIFEKFTQADESISRKYGGTGLGLAITKDIVNLMGGKINVQSTVDKGSTFMVEIPFQTTDQVFDDTFKKKRERINDRKKQLNATQMINVAQSSVLIAEDHPLNQIFIKKLLGSLGFLDFDIAENGQIALNMYNQKSYDIILMDCHMPQMTGYEATGKIREHEKTTSKHIPIIALTADAMQGTRDKCLIAGMDEYITKPIDRDELMEILSCWISFDNVSDGNTDTQTLAKTDTAAVSTHSEPNHVVLDSSALKQYADTHEEMQEFIDLFVKQSVADIAVLAESCTDGESKTWVSAAHKFKGAAGTIGAMRLHGLCAEAQGMEDVTLAMRQAMLALIQAAFDEACQQLEETKY